MVRFACGLADEELPGLAVMVGETFRSDAALRAFLEFRKLCDPRSVLSRGPSPKELGW